MLSLVAGLLIFLFLGVYYFIDWATLVGAKEPEAIALAGPVFLAIFLPKLIDIPIALTQRTQIAFQEGYNSYIWSIGGSILSVVSVVLNSILGAPKLFMILCSSLIPTVVTALNFIYYFIFTKRKKYFPRFKWFNINICKSMLHTGFGFLIIHILMNMGLSHMDSFIVGNIDSLSMAGDYSICLKVAAVINIICLAYLYGGFMEKL